MYIMNFLCLRFITEDATLTPEDRTDDMKIFCVMHCFVWGFSNLTDFVFICSNISNILVQTCILILYYYSICLEI